MARPSRKQEAQAQRPRKASKLSASKTAQRVGGHKLISSVIKPARPNHSVKAVKMVSAAGIFRPGKRGKHAQNAKKQSRVKSSAVPAEIDLPTYYKEGLEEAREAIYNNGELTFNNIHATFVEKLCISRAGDEDFLEKISAATGIFNAPLKEEQIETTFNRDGKRITEIVHIGQRLSLFQKSIEKDAAKLKSSWAQWEELQDDFTDLGVEIFGAEAFGEHDGQDENQRRKGYLRDMELLDLEHKTRKDELLEEVEELKDIALEKTTTTEKELDAKLRKNQGRLLQAYM